MSRYLVSTGNYTFPSYADIAAPMQQMAELQNEAADAYDTLDMQTSALANYISDNDPEVKARYDNYINNLTQLQDNLWKNGYNAGTRRQLAAARKGYAEDITAIDAAIKRRQEVSKQYRDARLKDPTLVQGMDPSRDSLDKYFRNDTYGTNWYSYSGADFQKQVAADAGNRKKEWIENAYHAGGSPGLPGWLLQKIDEGFTSNDVLAARDYVEKTLRGEDTSDSTVEGKLLGEVLLDNLRSTGAIEAGIDPMELDRLIGYGINGLSASIGETKVTNLQDILLQDEMKAARSGSGGGSGKPTKPTVTYDPGSIYIETGNTKRAAEIAKRWTSSSFGSYLNGEEHVISVPGEDGSPATKTFKSANEATEYIYHTPQRDLFLQHGLDIADPKSDLKKKDDENKANGIRVKKMDAGTYADMANDWANHTFIDETGKEYKFGDNLKYKVEVFEDGEWVLANDATLQYNDAVDSYQKHISDIAAMNGKNVSLEKIAMSPSEEKELRKKHNIDDRIDWRDIENIIALDMDARSTTNATLANQDTKDLLDYISDNVKSTYYANQGLGVNSEYAFRALNSGEVSSQGQSYNSVFKYSDDGKMKEGHLLNVILRPQDMIDGTITIVTENGAFVTTNKYLGDVIKSRLDAESGFENALGINLGQAISTAIAPITNPRGVLLDEGFDSKAWNSVMYGLFDIETLNRYGMRDPRNGYNLVDPKDVIRNENLSDNLLKMIVEMIRIKTGLIADEYARNKRQTLSSTNSNPDALSRQVITETIE